MLGSSEESPVMAAALRGASRFCAVIDYVGLPALGNRSKLPPGWRYTTLTPETDLVLGAKGTATVVQDELENTYQKLD
jgi:hypothetical protein